MDVVLQVIVLAVVQGLTEFLPVSSSAHLILVPWLLGWKELGLIFDVALHVGTLLAILSYFQKEWVAILKEVPELLRGNLHWTRTRILILILGTAPAVLFGILSGHLIESRLRSPLVTAICLIGFGILLWVAEATGAKTRTLGDAQAIDVLWMGMFQMFALIPGVSRSGVTITGGLVRGFRSWDAARISFLLSAPAIAVAGVVEAREAYHQYWGGPLSLEPLMQQAHPFRLLWLGIVMSALTGFLCMRYFLRFLRVGTMAPFVIYRIILGLAILGLLASGKTALVVAALLPGS
ncbi:MAG: undecaprenyl-diphosphate phosphatase [Acidobacteria bacterium]|nr:undecaprenyl-diphosphate phosphatase [Acidobacteriota bacterium]